MSKTIIGVILIVVGLISFMGGVIFQYNEAEIERDKQQEKYELLLDRYEELQYNYYAIFKQPSDLKFLYMWIEWSVAYHQHQIDNRIFTEDKTLEYHQNHIALYVLLKQQIQILEGKQVD